MELRLSETQVTQRRIRIIIQELDKGKYRLNTSRNISISDNTSVDDIQNIIINALTRYGIKFKC